MDCGLKCLPGIHFDSTNKTLRKLIKYQLIFHDTENNEEQQINGFGNNESRLSTGKCMV